MDHLLYNKVTNALVGLASAPLPENPTTGTIACPPEVTRFTISEYVFDPSSGKVKKKTGADLDKAQKKIKSRKRHGVRNKHYPDVGKAESVAALSGLVDVLVQMVDELTAVSSVSQNVKNKWKKWVDDLAPLYLADLDHVDGGIIETKGKAEKAEKAAKADPDWPA